MKPLRQPAPHLPLARVIAVVGCDGSGKSTLTADLFERLRRERPTELIYLGQSSGNILDWVRGLPLVGPAIGRYLLRKSERTHAKDSKSASPDTLTALVIYLLSCWRRHKFRRMLALNRRGVVVITDRYPQAEVSGFYFDGPGLKVTADANGFVRWLAARELRLYQRMTARVPALLIRLNIDADTAHARKPDHKLAMLHEKASVIPTLSFNGAHILDLDGRSPYPEVLQAASTAARAAIGPVTPGKS
jgi:thymidylate kinase